MILNIRTASITVAIALLLMTACGEKENQVFGVGEVDEPPAFRGEIEKYIQANLEYPGSAKEDSISGMVRVQFVVNDYGQTENIKITDSLSPACDSAVVEMIRQMPAWEPATIDDFPVRVLVEIPVKFEPSKINQHIRTKADTLSAKDSI